MKFKEGNTIRFGQDHQFWEGVPSGVDFSVSRFEGAGAEYVLRAHGYGLLGTPGGYGNGALYVYGLTKKQIVRFEKHLAKQTKTPLKPAAPPTERG